MHIKYIYKYIQHIHTIYSFEIIEKNLQIQCTNNFTILQCKAGTDPTFFFYLFHINFLAVLWWKDFWREKKVISKSKLGISRMFIIKT
jgi:hypothetical protein